MTRLHAVALAALAVAAAAAATMGDKDDAWVAPRKNWWSFRQPVRPAVPALRSPWVKTPVDAFVLKALQAKALTPAPRLSKEQLLRRVTLDLTGLPPTAEDRARFLADTSPKAYENLVDRLMASPEYGERWATKWLDVARYADTNGYETDAERTHGWRYRDYVVAAFNNDKPYDRFVQEQVAGDELFPGNQEALIATGFHRAGPIHLVSGNVDKEESRQEVLTEMTNGMSAAFLGLTVGCARCHNHKFDPIPQSDYYRLQATLAATEFKDQPLVGDAEKKAYEEAKKAYEAKLKPIKDRIAEIEKPYRERIIAERKAKLEPPFAAALAVPKDQRNEEQKRLAKEADDQIKPRWDDVLEIIPADERARRAELRKQMHRIEYEEPEPPAAAFAVVNMEQAPASHVLKVGNFKMKQDEVSPGTLRVLGAGPGTTDVTKSPAGRRSEVARWLSSPANPLTARVMVNRIWTLRMGRGIVATGNDFGVLGARPTHPELLDWLATEFVAGGWSVKKLDRLILVSSVYQMAVQHNDAAAKADADNKLYWRAHRRRLEGEFLRDSALRVAGALNPKRGGRPIKTPLEPEIYDLIFTEGEPDNLWPVAQDKTEHDRRSLYLLNKRTVRLPFLANFDQPDNMSSCPQRATSTHALQALSLMNSDMMHGLAKRFAARLDTECKTADCRVRRAYVHALAREPKPAEVAMARGFFAKGGPLEDFCLALLNRNEFAYLP
ncbi:MAG: DUF1549 domain-containing protein [Bryobacterales bacterium]|nr:DUF1549 domain-containing protein [Bryobacterales bacterium]